MKKKQNRCHQARFLALVITIKNCFCGWGSTVGAYIHLFTINKQTEFNTEYNAPQTPNYILGKRGKGRGNKRGRENGEKERKGLEFCRMV